MEREIANVAAASAMRGFRYLAFPPISFDPPVVELALPQWLTEPAATVTPAEAAPVEVTVSAPAAQPQELPAARPVPVPPTTALPLVPPTASPTPPEPKAAPAMPATERRFALLSEVSAELHRTPR